MCLRGCSADACLRTSVGPLRTSLLASLTLLATSSSGQPALSIDEWQLPRINHMRGDAAVSCGLRLLGFTGLSFDARYHAAHNVLSEAIFFETTARSVTENKPLWKCLHFQRSSCGDGSRLVSWQYWVPPRESDVVGSYGWHPLARLGFG